MKKQTDILELVLQVFQVSAVSK